MKKYFILPIFTLLAACSKSDVEDQSIIDATAELQTQTTETEVVVTRSSALRTDTDNDGINDTADVDVDGDGVADNGTDTDGDGINDTADVDIDNDGIDDNGSDIDGDGINDENDEDIDGDGIDNDEDEYASLSDSQLSDDIQQKITSYINTYHATLQIIKVEQERNKIEIVLAGGTELNFDAEGNFVSLDNDRDDASQENHDNDASDSNDGDDASQENHDNDASDSNDGDDASQENHDNDKYQKLSDLSAEVKKNIQSYIQPNYPNASITEIEIENNKIEVELNNGVEIVFDLNGNFVRLDD